MTTSSAGELLLTSRDARGVVTLTLNDPARFNALGSDMLTALQQALDALCEQAEQAVTQGRSFLILSDRAADSAHAPIPSLLALSAVHQH